MPFLLLHNPFCFCFVLFQKRVQLPTWCLYYKLLIFTCLYKRNAENIVPDWSVSTNMRMPQVPESYILTPKIGWWRKYLLEIRCWTEIFRAGAQHFILFSKTSRGIWDLAVTARHHLPEAGLVRGTSLAPFGLQEPDSRKKVILGASASIRIVGYPENPLLMHHFSKVHVLLELPKSFMCSLACRPFWTKYPLCWIQCPPGCPWWFPPFGFLRDFSF